jgi:hypothetical protein
MHALALEIEALCIAPFGLEEGTREELPDDEFGLVIGEPVRFRFFASNIRREDKVGTRLDYWTDEEFSELDEAVLNHPSFGRQFDSLISCSLTGTYCAHNICVL